MKEHTCGFHLISLIRSPSNYSLRLGTLNDDGQKGKIKC